jgi:hypothetical protein
VYSLNELHNSIIGVNLTVCETTWNHHNIKRLNLTKRMGGIQHKSSRVIGDRTYCFGDKENVQTRNIYQCLKRADNVECSELRI